MRSRVLLAAVLALPALAGAAVVERVLAVVEGAPILLSEVELIERLRGVTREAALEAVIDERLMFREASRLAQTALGAEEEERAYRSLATLAGEGFSDAELRRLARRQATILRYVEFRFGAQVRVDDEAVRKEWESSHPSGPEMAAADADRMRELLAAKALDERIEAWVAELREGADIRYNP
ncbi:MAG TPA: hypothetical protein VFQ51_05160 [Vicinamibacteria bacterium]|nr:hypothetical protein [Vicinamibacteria bacterium]